MVKCPYCGKKLSSDERWCQHCENDVSEKVIKSMKPHCFIATAAYGNPFIYEVQVLRNFRDEKLEKNFLGRAVINLYYKFSPPIARVLEKSETLKKIVRLMLRPIVNLIIKNK